MTRRVALLLVAAAAYFVVAGAESQVEDIQAVEARLADARRALAQASPEERPILEPGLIATEQALARYRALAAQGETRRKVAAPLWVAGGVLIADDATGVGVGDDPLLVVVGLGLAATYLATAAPPEQTQLDQAWRQVLAQAARTGDDALTLRVRRAVLDVTTPIATRAALQVMRQRGLTALAVDAAAHHQEAAPRAKVRPVAADNVKNAGQYSGAGHYPLISVFTDYRTGQSGQTRCPFGATIPLRQQFACDLQYEQRSDNCERLDSQPTGTRDTGWMSPHLLRCFIDALLGLKRCCGVR